MKDVGVAENVLGVKIAHDLLIYLLTLSHESYLKTMLKLFDMIACRPIDTPICRCRKLSNNLDPTNTKGRLLTKDETYAWIVGEAW